MSAIVIIVACVLLVIYLLSVGLTLYFLSKTTDPDSPITPKPHPATPTKLLQYELHDMYNWKGTDLRPTTGTKAPWEFFTNADPTHGSVHYDSHSELMEDTSVPGQLKISVQQDIAVQGSDRNSVRINTKDTFSEGLFVLSADHMPEGLATWPAFWLTGVKKAWACDGEIDIVEGVNSMDAESSFNAVTLHTSTKPGASACNQEGVPGITNNGLCYNADPATKDNSCGCDGNKSACPYAGCGVISTDNKSFGNGFNNAGGGVFVCSVVAGEGIKVWFFSKADVPADLQADVPDPDSWPITNLVAFKPCPGQFANMQLILNTTLCGDWAGDQYPGGGTAKEKAARCQAFVHDPSNKMKHAYWLINYVKIFQQRTF